MTGDNSAAALPFQLYASDLSGNIYGYNFLEARVHAPAEHTIEGQSFSLELQLFFTLRSEFGTQNFTRAAMSFLFQESQDKKVSVPILNYFQQALNGTATAVGPLSDGISSILPSPLSYFLYQGSDTIPTCDENILWYVVETPIDISTGQISAFDSIYKNSQTFANGNGNNRNIQALNGRVIKKGGVECEEQFIYFFSFVLLYAFINYFIFKLL